MALSRGCTIGLIIVAILVVIVIIIGALIYANWDSIKGKFIGTMINMAQEEVLKDIPDGYSESDVKRIFTDLKNGLEDETIDSEDIKELANSFQTALEDKTIDADEGRKLLELIQDALGQTPPMIEEAPFDTIMDSLEIVPEGG